jgi:glucose/arabinose dehydrogenase
MSIHRFRSPESRRPRKLRRAALPNGATLTLATLTLAALSLVAPPAARAGWNGLTRLTADAGQITSIAQPLGDAEHMFLATKTGQVRVLDLTTGSLQSELFLDIPGTDDEAEGGLLGLAFHPDYANNGKLYVTVTIDNGGLVLNAGTDQEVVSPYTVHLREYTAINGVVDQENYNTVLQWVKPTAFHNSGWLGFGPQDGLLYLTAGDGGTVWDAGPGSTPGIGNAQDLTDNWMGKVLRVDVGGDDFPDDPTRNYSIPQHNPYVGVEGDDEIITYGLRNPWGASWDRQTGDFWMGDVGQGLREEVTSSPPTAPAARTSAGGSARAPIPLPIPAAAGPPPTTPTPSTTTPTSANPAT